MNLLEKFKHFDFRSLGIKGIALAASIFLTSSVYSNPSLNNVGAGSVHFDRSQPNTLTIHQNSPRAILNWNQFNIQNGETTHFQQPAGGVALNRISPATGASTIYGRLTATGQIILINPAGFYFGPNSVVNVGGLIATTANISDQNFLNGIYKFQAVPGFENSSIINEGQIIAAQNGLIALVAPSVINNGVIRANLGTVVLASGSSFTMNFSGDNLISFAVDEGTLSSGGVSNRGTISANGGSILVTAKAASHVLDNVINMQGIAEAKSVRQVNGDLILGDIKIAGDERVGKVTIASNINVSGRGTGKGGRVTVTGNQVALTDSANIDASGDTGGGDVYIGGNYQGKGPLPNSTTTEMAPGAKISADALLNGNGGTVILWSDNYTKAKGSISARGGQFSGDGGFIETSSKNVLDVNNIKIDTRAPNGKTGMWLLDPTAIYITNNFPEENITFSGGTYQPTDPTGSLSFLDPNTLSAALDSSNITVTNANSAAFNPSDLGIISVDDPITWNSPYSLTLNALDSIYVYAPITASIGSLNIVAGVGFFIEAAITLKQGILSITTTLPTAGNAFTTIFPNAAGAIDVKGFNLVQGGWTQTAAGSTPFNATNFQINSGNGLDTKVSFIRSYGGSGTAGSPYQIQDVYGLQGIGSSPNTLGKSYILTSNIDATATRNWNSNAGFRPIGDGSTSFTGNLNGNGFVISNLYIYRPSLTAVGLLAYTNGNTISNLGVIDANITSGGDAGILAAYGGTSTLTNVFTTGTLTSVGGSPYSVGGLVGYTHGTISNTYSSASVTSSTPYAGGLIGYAGASPNVATISDSYATGSVVGTGGNAGGFAGVFDTGTITRAYSSGAVSGSGNVHGFVGQKLTGTITNSFYDTSTSGQATSGSASGVTGATTANLKLLATYSGSWGANITSTPSITSTLPASAWLIINGQTRPILRSELNGFNSKINTAHQLQLMAFALDGDYTLLRNIDASGTSNAADVWGGGSGFYPVGNSVTGAFTGTINGQGNIITSFNMPRASTTDVGLVGYSNGGLTIQNLGIYGTVGGSGSTNVGAFAGHVINATLTNLFFNGALSGGSAVGGIVGYFDSGSVTKNYAAGTISGSGTNIGGIVGVVESASNVVDLLNNYNIASVSGGSQVGGIAGGIFPTNIINIETSYNAGLITGTTRGALVGFAQSPAAAFRNYFDSNTSGASSGVGAVSGLNSTFTDEFVGLTTTASKSSASYNSWGITNTASTTSSRPAQTWFIFEGETRPILLSEWGSTTTTPFTVNTPHQVQLMAVARGASYTLGRDIDLSAVTSNARDIWNNGGFIPIGTSSSKFTGNFNGNYYNLQNMTISRSTTTTAGDNTGLFGYVSGSTIQNIGIVDATVSGHDAVGPLIGAGDNFYVFRAFAIGTTTGRNHTGGLIGFAAVENGTFNIGNSFSLGTVTSTGNNVGGLIGAADSFFPTTGVLSNSYSNANVSGLGSVGGLVGYANNISNIYQSYATGSVTGTNADVGGIIGYTNAGIVRDTYWDTDTSGTSYPGTFALYAGGNSATGNNTATMMTQSSYASTWDFTNDWGIIDGKSYPYLRAFYYQTPRAISGVSNLGSNANVTITANGSAITSNNLVRATTKTAANGGYYFLQPNGAISNSVPILVYTTGGSANAVTFAPASGGSLTGLTLTNNALNLGDANTNTITNANLSTAKGSLGSLALYSISGSDLTVNSGINLNSTTNTTYSTAGNVIFTGGNGTVTFGGPVSLTGATQFIIAGIGDIIFSNTLNGNSKLTLSNSGTTRFSGVVGGSTPLNSLSSVGGGTTNIRANISTSGTQTYNEDVTLGDDLTTFLTYTLQSSAGAIDFLSTLNGPKYSLTANAATSITLNAFVGGAGQFQNLSLTAPTMNVYGGVDLEGNMIFTGNTVLGDNSSFIGRGASSDITFTGTLNSASDASPYILLIAAGDNIVLNGSLGNTGRLASIDASAGTAISFTGPTLVKSSDYQIYSGPIALSNDITFQSVSGNFNSTNGIAGVNSTTDLTIDIAGTTSSIDGVVSALSLVKAGTGTLALASGNTYSGTTTINGGALQIGSDSALGTAPGVATPGHLVLNGGALETTSNFTLNSNRGISLSAGGGTFRTNFATTLTYGGIIAGLGGLTKTGAGTLALTGTNSSYTGQTYIDNGILSVSKMSNGGVNSSIGATAAGSFILIGSGATGVLSYTGSGDSTDRLILLTGSGGALLQSTNGLLTLNGDISTSGNPLFFDTNPGNITSNGAITGTGTLTKGGSGLLRLLGTNTYSGSTTINAGTLQIAADSGLGTAPVSATPGHLTLNGGSLQTTTTFSLSTNRGISLGASGGTLSPDLFTTLSYSGVIAGSGALTKDNNGLLTLSGVNTYTGATNINVGNLQIFADSGLGQAPVSATPGHLNFGGGTLTTTGTFTLNANRGINLTSTGFISNFSGDVLTYNGVIAGSGGLSKSGLGTWILGGTNTYTGATSIATGTIQIAADSGLGQAPVSATPSQLILNGGILRTTASFVLNANRGINIAGGNGTVTTDPSTTLTYNGIMAGSGSLTKTGTGTLILGGNNSYTGATNINAGNIQIAADSGLGTAPVSATPGQLSLASGTLITTSSFVLNANRGISLGAGGGSFSPGASTTLTYNGIMAGSGALTKNGLGTLALGGSNSYTGITTLNSGTLQIAADSGLGQAPVSATPAFLNISTGSTLQTTGTFTLSANRGISLGVGGAIFLTDPSTTLTYNGIMAGSGTLTKSGTGTLILGGNNSYTGATSINAGTLQIAADSGLGQGPVPATPGHLSLAGGGALQTTGTFTLDPNRGISLGAGGGSISTDPSTTLTYNGIMAGGNAFTKLGTGTLILGGVNSYTGATNINAGNIQIAADSGLGQAPGAATPGQLSLASGTLITTASFVLNANRGINLGAGGGSFSPGASTTLTYNGIMAGSGALTKNGLGTLALGGSNSYTGITTLNSGTLQIAADSGLGTAPVSATPAFLNISTGSTLQTTGTFTLSANRGISLGVGGAIFLTDPSTTLTYNGIMAGSGTLTKSGTGTLILGGNNSYTGATSVNAGTLQIAADSGLGTAPVSATPAFLNISTGSTLRTTGTFTLSANRGISLGVGGAIFLTDPSTTLTYNGIMAGSGTLTKSGTGTLILGGNNSYTGATSINAGTLQIAADSGLGQAPGAATPGQLTLAGGALQTTGTFTLDSNRGISLGAGGGSISTDPSTTLTYNGIMAGGNAFTKLGTGTLILGGSNSYTGATSINAGTLQIAGDSGLGTAPGAATPGHLNLDGGTLVTTNAFTINANRGINLGSSGGTVSPNVGLVLTYDGIVAGTGALTKAGAGLLSLGGINTYGGGTNLNAGTIIATNNTALSTGAVTGATNSTLQINSGINLGNALSLQGNGVGGVGALVAGGSGAVASGAITLAGATTIGTGASASNTLLLSNTLNGAFALTTQGSGSLAFGSTVGDSSPLASLASNTNLIISGGSIVTSGSQTYNNPVTLAGITTLSTTNSAVAFNSTLDTDTTPRNLTINAGSGTIDLANVGTGVNGAIGDLALNSTNTTTLGGLIINAASLTTNSGGTTNLNTATLTTTGSTGVVFNDAVNVGVNSQISADTGPITFGSTLDSPLTRTLTLNTSGTTRFNDKVGDLNPFSSITTDAGGTTFINTSNLYASGLGMFFNDNVLINQPSVVLFTTGSISFGGTLDSNTGTNYELQAIGNAITVNGAVGATRPLDNFAIIGNSTINAPSITTSGVGGSQTYAGDVTLGNNVNFNADSSIDFFGTVNGAFNIGLNAAGTTTFGDNVGLTTAPTAINSTGAGDVNFFGAVGDATHRLGTISIAGNTNLSSDVYTSGDQSYLGGLALNIDALLDTGASATSDISIAGITGNNFGLTLNSAGNTQLSGSITGLDNITTNAAGTTTIGASISTSARQTYNDNVTLSGATTLTSTGDDIIFAGNLAGGGNTFAINNVGNLSSIAGTVSNLSGFSKQGSGRLTLSGNNTYTGTTTVSGGILSAQSNTALGSGAATVNSGATLQVNNNSIANNLTLSGTGTSGQGALVAANANSTVNGNITLAAATTVGSLSVTDVLLLNGTVSGGQALTLSGSGSTTLGNTVNVASVTSNTATTLQSSVTTSGNQSYNNAVTLGGTTSLNSSAGNGSINFASSINGANSLAINSGSGSVGFNTIGLTTAPTNLSSTGSGTVTFNGVVGDNTHRLTSVAITGPSNLNGGPIFTSGDQTYSGAMTLGNSTTLDTGAGAGNTLSLNAVSGNQALVLNNAGTTELNGTISGLASLTTNAPGQTNIGANVTTSGNQTYNDPVLLTNNATLTSSSGNVVMAQNVNGGGNTLTINNAGVASFIVGILSNASIVKDGPGTLTLSSANTYSGSTTISGGKLAIVDPAGLGDVQGETIVTSGVTLDIGATGPINEPITLINGILSGTGAASLTGAVTLANNTTNTIQSNVGSTFDINGNINSETGGTGNLVFQGAGTVNVNGSIGNTSALASLISNADLSVTGSVRTSGNQTYNNAVTLASTANFTSLNGNVEFANALNGNSNLSINSGGTTTISDVGLATPLASLAINAGSGITMNGNNVVTAGNQSYTGVVTLTLPTEFVLNDDQAAITFNNGIVGGKNVAIGGFTGNHNFTINGALDVGNVTVDGFGSGNVFTLNNGNSQTWSLTGANDGGIVTAGANSILFTGMDRVVGGSANDIFNLGSTAFAGTIGGGGGTNTLVATNASNTWTIDAVNGGTVTGLGGTFVNMQNLTGGTSDDSFTINGGKVAGTLDGGQGTNTLTGDNNNKSTWTITGSDAGKITTANNNVGVNSFKNIQNLAGGASDNEFYLSGGSVSGNISGGSANDTIYANAGTPNTFNIGGTDAGTMTGVGGTFNNIENLTGGNQGNTFIFANNAKLNGYAMGGSLSQKNMLDYTAYGTPVQVFLTGNINDGNVTGMSGMINRFGSINDIATNIGSRNELTFPNTPNKVVITGTGAGYVNDPTNFTGFTVFHGGSGTNSIVFLTNASLNPDGTVSINGVDHSFSGFDLSGLIVTPNMTMNIASIIQQPDTNHSDATQSDSTWLAMADSTVKNLNDIIDQAAKNYDTNLSKVKINPYCYAAQ